MIQALRHPLGLVLCAAALSACGARSSLLDIDSWLEGERAEREGAGAGGQGGSIPLDPGRDQVCGKALKGPLMVLIPLPDGSSFCIDSTEVSNRHYEAFLQAAYPFSQQTAYCAWNDSYIPGFWLSRPGDNYPVVTVDWCDARAYCAWAGKRLCGKIGGGRLVLGDPPSFDPQPDPLQEEWAYACTAGGTRVYPYGDVYDKTGCVTLTYDGEPLSSASDHVRPIREAKKCEGGFPGLYDMGGNADEWVDESNKETGKDDRVATFSPYYASWGDRSRCIDRSGGSRDGMYGATGIRCCKTGP